MLTVTVGAGPRVRPVCIHGNSSPGVYGDSPYCGNTILRIIILFYQLIYSIEPPLMPTLHGLSIVRLGGYPAPAAAQGCYL